MRNCPVYNKEWRAKPKNKMCKNIANKIQQNFTHNIDSKTFKKYTGYSLNNLRKHFEAQFRGGMSWDNYGHSGWHVDHIYPITSFDFSSYCDEAFKACWALKNLQPLWFEENLRKGITYEGGGVS